MKFGSYSTKLAIILLFLLVSTSTAFAQKGGPRQEKLLNGLKVLMWSAPKADKVTVKIRIHSGSAFDPQQKEGTMYLLARNLFPNEGAREFFSEELGGTLELISNYDYIQVTATATPDHLLEVLQTLANAVSNPNIDKETTARLRAALIEKVRALDKDPAYAADKAALARLYGTFPYGRPQMGTVESINRIDFADLISARERFLTADNATITLTGNYNSDQAYRAVRRYFGAWQKSDKKVPSTFRQPDDPDPKPFVLGPEPGFKEVRYAIRGLARSDKDFPASEILVRIIRTRLQEGKPPALGVPVPTVLQDAHILPGHIIFGRTLSSLSDDITNGKMSSALIPQNITAAEVERARSEVIAEITGEDLQERWLDVETFKSSPVSEEIDSYRNLTLADVQRVAERLARNPVVTVVYTAPAEAAAPAN